MGLLIGAVLGYLLSPLLGGEWQIGIARAGPLLRPNNSGGLAIFTAIRRASSLVSICAAVRRLGSSSK
jgi:hypothetical protein